MIIVTQSIEDVEKQVLKIKGIRKILGVREKDQKPDLHLVVDELEECTYEILVKRVYDVVDEEDIANFIYVGDVFLKKDWHIRHIFIREIRN